MIHWISRLVVCSIVLVAGVLSGQETLPGAAERPKEAPSALIEGGLFLTRLNPAAAIAPDISGVWRGDDWGNIELRQRPGLPNGPVYTGTYTDTFGNAPGEIELTWSHETRRFDGKWSEKGDRAGKLSVRLLADGKTIRGSWTTNPESKIQPGKPEHSDLEWVREQGDSLVGSGAQEITVFALANMKATDCLELLQALFPTAKVSADSRTNSLILVSDADVKKQVEALLIRLDEAKPAPPPVPGASGIDFVTPSSPQQLQVAIAEHEALAASLAKQIRKQAGSMADNHPDQVKLKQALSANLAKALDLKLQLEHQQITQLEERLARLQTQLKLRKTLSGKIVERRASELVHGDVLDWNAPSPEPLPAKPGMENSGKGRSSSPRQTKATFTSEVHVQGDYGSTSFSSKLVFDQFLHLTQGIPGLSLTMSGASNGPEGVYLSIQRGPGQPVAVESNLTEHERAVMDQVTAALKATGITKIVWATDRVPIPEETPDRTKLNGLPPAQTEQWRQIFLETGIVFAPVDDVKLLPPSCRGGLRIKSVDDAWKSHPFKTGDILVGIGNWETVSPEDVQYAIRQPRPDRNSTPQRLSGYVIRDGKFVVCSSIGLRRWLSTPDVQESSPISLELWIDILKDNPRSLEVIRKVGSLGQGPDTARALAGLLSASQPLDYNTTEDGPIFYEITTVIQSLPNDRKLPGLIEAMSCPIHNVQWAALCSIKDLKEFANVKEFPALAEQVFKYARGSDVLLKTRAMTLLMETLRITKLDPAEFSTEERRELARQLKANCPREQIIKLAIDSLASKQIDTILTGTNLFFQYTDGPIDPAQVTSLMIPLIEIVEGKVGDEVATAPQRMKAMGRMASLGPKAEPAVPALIKLFKSEQADEEVDRDAGRGPTTLKAQVVQTLGLIGPAAKDALPILEEALAAIEKKTRQDQLLTGAAGNRQQISSPSILLRGGLQQAISRIKGQVPLEGRFR